MLLSQKIEQMTCRSADAQRQVGIFLLKEKQNVANYSMQEIADATYSSKPTLVRIAKKLGYSGWNDFLEAYLEELRYMAIHMSDIDVNMPFGRMDNCLEIAGKLSAVRQESCQETLELLDERILAKSAELLIQAKRIGVFGISVNHYMGQMFQHKMVMIGKPVEVINQSEQRFLAQTFGAEDCAVLISYSGNDRQRFPTALLEGLKKQGVPIIGITSMGDNLLRSDADYVFTIASKEKLYTKISSFATETSIMLLLDTLYACCFARNYERNLTYKVNLSRNVEHKRYSTSSGILEETVDAVTDEPEADTQK